MSAIVLKSQALSVRVKPFIDAARVAGGGDWHVIFRHIVPNVLPLSFLYMMFTVTEAISLEATLSFLGLLNVPMSWGIMINTAATQGYLLGGHRLLVAPAPRRAGGDAARLRILPGGAGNGRSGQPQAPRQVNRKDLDDHIA